MSRDDVFNSHIDLFLEDFAVVIEIDGRTARCDAHDWCFEAFGDRAQWDIPLAPRGERYENPNAFWTTVRVDHRVAFFFKEQTPKVIEFKLRFG